MDGDAPPEAVGEPVTPAVLLDGTVAYVRGWDAAMHATHELRRELRRWGLDGPIRVRVEVTAGGAGVVQLGWVTPDVARQLAELLAGAGTSGPSGTGGGAGAGRPPRAA